MSYIPSTVFEYRGHDYDSWVDNLKPIISLKRMAMLLLLLLKKKVNQEKNSKEREYQIRGINMFIFVQPRNNRFLGTSMFYFF